MQLALAIIAYIIAILLLAAATAYPLYLLSGRHIEIESLISRPAMLYVAITLVLFFYLKRLNLKQAAGLSVSAPALRHDIIRGWLYGFIMLLALSVALILLDVRRFDNDAFENTLKLLAAPLRWLATGLLVAVIEETFFRGIMFSGFAARKQLGWAIVFPSLIYALVHFLRTPEITFTDPGWSSGFAALAAMLANVPEKFSIDGFLALFAVGVFLAYVRLISGHIGYSIGLHAGWVFVIGTTKALTDRNRQADFSYLVSSYDGMTGYLATGLILFTGISILLYRRHTKPTTEKHKENPDKLQT